MGEVEEMVCVVCCIGGIVVMDVFVDFVYDLRKRDLFVLSWARVRRVRR